MPKKRGERKLTGKWEVIRELREAIREEPRSIGEILDVMKKKARGQPKEKAKQYKKPRTTIDNWLREPLEALDLIFYKSEDRRWYPAESRLPDPGTPAWNLAVKHAQTLLHGREGEGGPGDWQMHFLIQLLVNPLEGSGVGELLAHIRTGYPSVHDRLKDYKQALQPKKAGEKTENLFKELAGELSLIFRQVEMGPRPLQGFCYACPHIR